MKGKSAAIQEMSLDTVLDLNAASGLHSKLMAARGGDLAIDASAVERLGGLCIQVLMSAARTWEQEKHSLTFSKMSDAFVKTMQLSGVNYENMLAKESD